MADRFRYLVEYPERHQHNRIVFVALCSSRELRSGMCLKSKSHESRDGMQMVNESPGEN